MKELTVMNEKILLSEVDEIIAGGPEENERVALCSYHGHEGIIDVEGNVIVPFKYSSINGFVWDESGRLAVVNDEGLLGHVDINGNEVIPCIYPFRILSEPFCFHEDRFPIIDQNGLIGFIDPSGKVIISGQYHNVRSFANGYCAVQNEKGLWGYIDKDGQLKKPFKYVDAYSVSKEGEAIVKERICFFFTRLNTIEFK